MIRSSVFTARTKRVGPTVSGRALFRATFIAASVLMLSSCALLKGAEPPRDTYEISAPSSFSGIRGGTRAQLLVKGPTALDAINSQRMILRPSPNSITYIAGAQWSDTVQTPVRQTNNQSHSQAAGEEPVLLVHCCCWGNATSAYNK